MDGPVYVGSSPGVAPSPGSRTVGLFPKGAAHAGWEHRQAGLPDRAEIRALAAIACP